MTSTNGSDGNRLDRIEEILAQTAALSAGNASGLAETRKLIESNARAIEANSAQTAANTSGLAETRAIVESNAIAISENTEAIASLREVVLTFIDGVQVISQRLDIQGEEIREIATQVRGLQTENHRILEILERGEGRQG